MKIPTGPSSGGHHAVPHPVHLVRSRRHVDRRHGRHRLFRERIGRPDPDGRRPRRPDRRPRALRLRRRPRSGLRRERQDLRQPLRSVVCGHRGRLGGVLHAARSAAARMASRATRASSATRRAAARWHPATANRFRRSAPRTTTRSAAATARPTRTTARRRAPACRSITPASAFRLRSPARATPTASPVSTATARRPMRRRGRLRGCDRRSAPSTLLPSAAVTGPTYWQRLRSVRRRGLGRERWRVPVGGGTDLPHPARQSRQPPHDLRRRRRSRGAHPAARRLPRALSRRRTLIRRPRRAGCDHRADALLRPS